MLLHDWVRRTVTVEHFVNSSHPIAFPAKFHALVDILDMKWMWNDTPGWFAVCWRNRVLVGTASELQWSQKGLHLKLLSNRLSHLSSSKKCHLKLKKHHSNRKFYNSFSNSIGLYLSKKLRRQRVAGWFWYWLQQCGCQQWEGTTGCERSFCHGFCWDALWGQEGGHCARFLGVGGWLG